MKRRVSVKKSIQSSNRFDYKKMVLPLVLIFVIAVLASYIIFNDLMLPTIVFVPDLSTEGFSEVAIGVNITNSVGIVSMIGNCYDLSVAIDRSQAISMYNGINGIISERPNSHDLMKDLLNSMDAKVLMVKITDVRNGTFYGKMIIRQRNLVISLDSRPSDALAVAARTNYDVPIYVSDEVLKTGTKIC